MKKNNYGELIFNDNDLADLLMQGRDISSLNGMLVDSTVNIEKIVEFVDDFPNKFVCYNYVDDQLIPEWDHVNQQNWHMPQEYKDTDIAQYILNLCENEAELQRCGEELLLYQERDLFNLLKFLKYLVDIMRANNVIWGVGRGSSVSSFVLYKMGVHRINSMFYKLHISEFLR
jgi:DNA polymerase III alpha subunit